MKHNIIIYDLEILRAIPDRNGQRDDGIEYCAGWGDHLNMGISVLCAYDYQEDQYRVFCGDNRREFLNLVGQRRPLCVGFNNLRFDNAVLTATKGWDAPAEDECYDLLREIWLACGLGPEFVYPSHTGYSLDAMCEANFGMNKTGNGGAAPVLWQLGNFGAVIDYCLNDVRLTKQLLDCVLAGIPLINPKVGGTVVLRNPLAPA